MNIRIVNHRIKKCLYSVSKGIIVPSKFIHSLMTSQDHFKGKMFLTIIQHLI